MSKYLDSDGLLYLWQKAKATFAKISHTHTTADVTGLDAALTNANKVTDVKVNGTSVVTNKSANITVDSTLSTTSNNPIKNSTVATKFNSVDSAISGKQDKLTFDSAPTANSTKPVTSGGVKSALDAKQNKLTFDSTPQGDSYNPVYSDGIYTALAYKQDELTFDDEPKSASSNPVTSDGIKQAIDTASSNIFMELNKKAAAADLTSHTGNSTVHVTEAEHTKLAGIEEGANRYNLPTATENDLGGVKVGILMNIHNGKLNPNRASSSQDGIISSDDYKRLQNVPDSSEILNAVTEDTSTLTVECTSSTISLIKSGAIGAANGVAPLNESMMIDSQYLPSYVDDVIEVCTYNETTDSMIGSANWFRDPDDKDTVISGEKGKVYIVVAAWYTNGPISESDYKNSQWRWTGSQYVRLTDGSGISPITNSEIDAIVAK